jgi:hypothetical protein
MRRKYHQENPPPVTILDEIHSDVTHMSIKDEQPIGSPSLLLCKPVKDLLKPCQPHLVVGPAR